MGTDIESRKQLEFALVGLCESFGLPEINVKLGKTPGRAWYFGPHKEKPARIVVSIFKPKRYKRKVMDDLIHEFAHYLTHFRNGMEKGKTGNHGPKYRKALTEVAQLWYGSAKLYPWKTEYKSLAKLGPCAN